ncbi:MAG: hypothetical protein AAGB31_14135 [Bdellovibrio sp.]
MKLLGVRNLVIYSLCGLFATSSSAAILHFYNNPRVEQAFFHVTIEFQGFIYDADTFLGAIKYPVAEAKKVSFVNIEIADELVNKEILEAQLGKAFDYTFTWDNDKTYCSKMVGMALGMQPQPMSFEGTHYLRYYPHWASRTDPGISLDQIHEFGMQHQVQSNP